MKKRADRFTNSFVTSEFVHGLSKEKRNIPDESVNTAHNNQSVDHSVLVFVLSFKSFSERLKVKTINLSHLNVLSIVLNFNQFKDLVYAYCDMTYTPKTSIFL